MRAGLASRIALPMVKVAYWFIVAIVAIFAAAIWIVAFLLVVWLLMLIGRGL
jgi:hypothetical protein